MLNVYFTIDVEVWCDGWQDIDRKFPDSFGRYIYGPEGEYGLPFQLRVLSDHGLKGVCFVEPLFAGRFGQEPLSEIVGLIEDAGHESQLHMHTEWVDEARPPLLPRSTGKRRYLRDFNVTEQSRLLSLGINWLERAGALRPMAFRAGSFGFNQDTLAALAENKIYIDSSYNATMMGPTSGVRDGELLEQPCQIGEVLELPMTIYDDGRRLRHVQLTACSWSEIEHLLWQALEYGHQSFVILSHGSELLTPGARAVDHIAVTRFRRLCEFLEVNSSRFRVGGFRGEDLPAEPPLPTHRLGSPLWRTGLRMAEQVWRRRYSWGH